MYVNVTFSKYLLSLLNKFVLYSSSFDGSWVTFNSLCLYTQKGDGNAIIQNGKLELHNGREYKAIANIHCNPGYELNGINTTTCLITGLWDE